MDIVGGNFDKVGAIRYLAREQRLLTATVGDLAERVTALESVQPSANMDAAGKGANLYLGDGFSEKLHLALYGAGYSTGISLRVASDEELLAVEGVGPATLAKIRAALK